jgi:recombinational DNA repair protein RecT
MSELTKIEVINNNLMSSPILSEVLGKGKDKYILSVLNEIKKTQGGDTAKDLTTCTPESIVRAVKTACDLNLEIDSRQHCHLVKHNKNIGTDKAPNWISEASLWIGYRGFIYSIKRVIQDANIDVQMVYKDDEFKVVKEGDKTSYTLVRNNPFGNKTDIVGGFCYISYTINGRLVSFCETVSLVEINKIKGKAKTQTIWDSWFEEKAKAAIIKRACKVHFSGLQEIANIAEFDNQEYEMKDVSPEEQEYITQEQGIEIENLGKLAGVSNSQIAQVYGAKSFLELPAEKFEEIIERLKKKIATVKPAKVEENANNPS